ncbi:MAG: DNA mismatch repair protein MutS [Syntrophomonadaceae bacterium]|nr:DNA mismatch repair protein MutS [Syntrophomonadaceae bacterium]
MHIESMKTLEYDKLKEILKGYAISAKAGLRLEELQPSTELTVIKRWLLETTEARHILDINSSVPLSALENIDGIMNKSGKDGVLNPDELIAIKELLVCVKKLKKFMNSLQTVAPTISPYAWSMFELPDLYEEIDRCILNGSISDRATPELGRIRKRMVVADERVKHKLNSILSSSIYSSIIRESLITMRDGRYVIPVKKEHKKSLAGNVLDVSASGSTLFIEPAAIVKLQEELNILKIEEQNEVLRILSMLTEMVLASNREISINVETIAEYDFIFAKAKYSKALDASPVDLNTGNFIKINGGRHPLLGKEAVPLDFEVGRDYSALIITGPNTGGKTVALKTAGLLTLMVQSGLHVPVETGSEFAVFNSILADIGDGQSIEQSLSTFSAHVKNISAIIEAADPNSLVILDELGAGTDPGEGMGFAIAILEEIFKHKATILATTHISEIKAFAQSAPGFEIASMAFDLDSLRPLYKLSIGRSGESNALLIALRLGVKREIIERAHELSYREKKDYSSELSRFNESLQLSRSNAAVQVSNSLSNNVADKPERLAKYQKTPTQRFNKGDCVYISTMQRTGIVYEPENGKGEVVVMVMKKKFRINHKRLNLYIEGKELYPENYDLDIVFESKENRKKRKQQSKHHIEGLIIESEEEL